jgi:hypothetical protein
MPGRRMGLIPNFLYCPHPPGLIYLDDVVGPSRVLLPVAGEPRRKLHKGRDAVPEQLRNREARVEQ